MKKNFLIAVVCLFTASLFTACSNEDNPSKKDDRINKVVPEDIRKEIEKYIPIFDGVNPPNVEGVYLIENMACVYDQTGDFYPGDLVIPTYVKFHNQNMKKNTLDYAEKEGDDYEATGDGAFISGDGKNFTIFFNTEGVSAGVKVKTALVISGTIAKSGVKNLFYAFVLVEKGDDPNHWIMDEGAYRIFKDEDGLSVKTEWPNTEPKDNDEAAFNPLKSMFVAK